MSDSYALKRANEMLNEIKADLSIDELAAIAYVCNERLVVEIHKLPRFSDSPYSQFIDERKTDE